MKPAESSLAIHSLAVLYGECLDLHANNLPEPFIFAPRKDLKLCGDIEHGLVDTTVHFFSHTELVCSFGDEGVKHTSPHPHYCMN
jgi:hypothetical protein